MTLVPQRMLDPAAGLQVAKGLCALGVMTKVPEAGKVKTRLTPPLTPEESAELNKCFLRDTARAIAAVGDHAQGVGVYTPAGRENAYADILPHNFTLIPQRGASFAERLVHATEDLLRVGYDACCLIDSDSPTVSTEAYQQAAAILRKPGDRVVIGPSDDGGYYLIGMKKLYRNLFERIDWSTEQVFEQTMERAAEAHIEVHTLATFYDVDDKTTLIRLCDELLDDGGEHKAPATRRFLAELIEREGRGRIWPQ